MPASLIIACLSQKGGVGKSTIARLIARTYAKAEWRVKIADFNTKQKTSVDWAADRMSQKLEPEIAAEAFTSLKTALRQDWELLVIDGRPDSDTSSLEIAKEAHLTIIPTGITTDDLRPQVAFADELSARGIRKDKILFVVNKTTDSVIAVGDARLYIERSGYKVAKEEIPYQTGYQMAQNAGKSINETAFLSLNKHANRVADEIVSIATQLQGLVAA